MDLGLRDPRLFKEKAYIGGEWRDSISGRRIEVKNPSNQMVVGTVPECTAAEAAEAINAASQAQARWKMVPAKERANLLRAWFNLVIENREDLARLLTVEQGKPLAEARAEITYSGAYIEWFAEEAKRAYGDIVPGNRAGTRLMVFKEPVGVVGAITPWNFPSAMLARKIAPALAAGCSIVAKPAELTPFSALALAALAERAGLPKGLINIINGVPEIIGGELTSNPQVRKITFTGSTRTGKVLLRQASDTVKKVSMELGGNAPFMVFESADVDEAVKGAIFAKFRNNGQTCICVNRFFIHDRVYDEFRDKLKSAVSALKIGDGLEEGVDVGPLINKSAVQKVQDHIGDALNRGASLCCGGKGHSRGPNFFEPTILDGLTVGMKIAHEETFGPVVALFRFSDESHAVRAANDTEFGLAGYFFSRDVAQIFRVAEQLEVGMLGVNDVMISAENIPFGGVKESGFGREGSKYGLDDYMQTKYMCLGGIK